jgi:hypothetical protein
MLTTGQKQDILKEVIDKINGQGGYSGRKHDHGVVCMYRGPERRKCAIGMLMPDEVYNRDMEGKTFRLLVADYPAFGEHLKARFPGLELPGVCHFGRGILGDNDDVTFFAELQLLHDTRFERGLPPPSYDEGLSFLRKKGVRI